MFKIPWHLFLKCYLFVLPTLCFLLITEGKVSALTDTTIDRTNNFQIQDLPPERNNQTNLDRTFWLENKSKSLELRRSALFAQNLPTSPSTPVRPIEPTPTPQPRLEPLPPPEELLESPQTPTPNQKIPEFPGTIDVKGFKVVGSTVFSQAELDQVLKDFTNRPLTFAELLQAEAAVTKLYVDRGYINSGAVIPEQTIQTGIVTIQAIEGSLEDIQVNVSGKLNPNYVRKRLASATDGPLNVRQLQEALQLLQLDPLVENLSAELSVGSRREKWLLAVDVNEAQTFRPRIFADNSRTPSVGSFQRGIEINENNLTGDGDAISLAYKNTDGSDEIGGNYTIPINANNGTLGLRYRHVDSEIIEEPFDELDIESTTDNYELTLRQPVIRKATAESTQELALGMTTSLQRSKTTLKDRPFQLSPGAELDGKTNITALRFFQDWTQRSSRDVFVARSQFSVGLDAIDATINEDEPDGRFFAWRGQLQWLRRLAENNTNLLIRTDVQLSSTELLPLEQFGLGGIESVRGYRQDALLTDNGVFASAEVRVPVYTWNDAEGSLSVVPFVDFGSVWNSSGNPNPENNTLVSTGVGLQVSISESFQARLDWGIPLVDLDSDSRDKTWQENGVYFSLQYFPF